MNKEKISVEWKGNYEYTAQLDGYELTMDIPVAKGGEDKGFRPKALLLPAIGGCTGMDISSLAQKMRVDIKSLTIDVEATAVDEVPAVYDSFKIIYKFEADEEHANKILRMVELSMERYCTVSAMLSKSAKISYSVFINDKPFLEDKEK